MTSLERSNIKMLRQVNGDWQLEHKIPLGHQRQQCGYSAFHSLVLQMSKNESLDNKKKDMPRTFLGRYPSKLQRPIIT
jgi:hypothetical protein